MTRFLQRLVGGAAEAPRTTLGLLLLVTLGLGAGLFQLRFQTGILDWLPANNSDVDAFTRVVAEIDGITNQELVWVALDAEKAGAAGVSAITDEAAIRAQEELAAYVRERVPEVRYVFGLPYWVKLANYGTNGVFELPGGSSFSVLWQGVYRTQRELLSATISSDERAALLGFAVGGDPLTDVSRETGRQIRAALADYRGDSSRRYDLFRDDLLVPVGLASGVAAIDAQLRRDVLLLGPLALLLVIVVLYLAFRQVRVVLLALACLGVGLTWVFGLMGWLGVGLNVVNIALLPLLLGSGIDYAIHALNSYQAARGRRERLADVFADVAAQSGVALSLVTVITALGLVSLGLAQIPGLVELGTLAAFGMVALWLLVLTLPPAVFALLPQTAGAPYRPSRRAAALLSGVARHRWVAVGLIVVASVGTLAVWGQTRYQLDVIQGNFPADDPISEATERIRQGVGSAFPEFVIFEGDLSGPDFLAYSGALAGYLQSDEAGLGDATQVISLNLALGSYEILKDGVGSAVGRFVRSGGDLSRAAPDTSEEIRAALSTMHDEAPWQPLAKLLSNEAGDLAVLVVIPGLDAGSFEGTGRLKERLELSLAAVANQKPDGIDTAVLGYRTITYLFIQTSLFWMRALFVVSVVVAGVLIGLVTRRAKPVIVLALVMTVTGAWWVGLLNVAGLYVSVFLIFPLVFIVSLGSDYAIHLIWGAQRGQDDLYADVGKAVVFSALTDAAVFGVFGFSYLVSVGQVMIGVALAVLAIFVGTVLVVPLFIGNRSTGDKIIRDSADERG
ncbi:MAG: MMPL family transporter [Trueperaceae bacterium]|nr:MMPL family transporter [Trueperaceae bacterium]